MLIITASIANVASQSVFNLFEKVGYSQANINFIEDGIDEQEFRKLTDGANNYVLPLENLNDLQQLAESNWLIHG